MVKMFILLAAIWFIAISVNLAGTEFFYPWGILTAGLGGIFVVLYHPPI